MLYDRSVNHPAKKPCASSSSDRVPQSSSPGRADRLTRLLLATLLAQLAGLACAPAVAPEPDAGLEPAVVDANASVDAARPDRGPSDGRLADLVATEGNTSELQPHDSSADSSGTDAGAARDPVVFVHGYLGHAEDWDEMIAALEASGWSGDELFAIQFGDTNDSILDLASLELAPFVQQVLQSTGASRVDMVGHSLGGMVARTYVSKYGGGDTVRDLVFICAPLHGNNSACLTTSFGASSRQLCPAYAGQADSVDSVQWDLNGDPDSADIDETPFGTDQGGGVSWSAIVYSADTIVMPDRKSVV